MKLTVVVGLISPTHASLMVNTCMHIHVLITRYPLVTIIIFHKPMRIQMESLVLGVNTLYMLFFFQYILWAHTYEHYRVINHSLHLMYQLQHVYNYTCYCTYVFNGFLTISPAFHLHFMPIHVLYISCCVNACRNPNTMKWERDQLARLHVGQPRPQSLSHTRVCFTHSGQRSNIHECGRKTGDEATSRSRCEQFFIELHFPYHIIWEQNWKKSS